MSPGVFRRRALLAVLALTLISGLLLAEALRSGPLWRSAYPHLPRRAQALPYQLRARWPGAEATPVALPTPELAGRARESSPAPQALLATPLASPEAEAGEAPSPLPPSAPDASGRALPATVVPTQAAREIRGTPSPLPPLPEAFEIEGIRHEFQTWNNCGPATISMALSKFGAEGGQSAAARILKPDPEDKNVGPEELASYARSLGFETRLRVGGDMQRLQALLQLGLPVIVETWFVPEPGDEMGHYLLLTGYRGRLDDPDGHFLAADSYHGPRVELSYADFDALWRVFNRLFLVAAPSGDIERADALLETAEGEQAMWTRAAARARAEIEGGQDDAFAWFNLGSSQLALDDPASAAAAFDRARGLGLPWRMLWYQQAPFEAYAAMARWSDVRGLAAANLANAGNLEESQYWLGRALEAESDFAGARQAFEAALRAHPSYAPAVDALARLP